MSTSPADLCTTSRQLSITRSSRGTEMSLHRLGFLALASYVAAFTLLGPAACSSASHDATGPATSDPQITLIANPTSVTSVAQIVLSASVTAGSGAVQKVEFYERITGVDASARKIGEDAVPPYEFSREIQSVADNGMREYTAKAYDVAQHVGVSNAVMVAVKLSADTPPLTPGVSASHTSITTPGQIKFTVVTDKAVARIEVDNGDAKVAEVVPQSEPYVVSVPVTSAN